jgi:hypothetical protein
LPYAIQAIKGRLLTEGKDDNVKMFGECGDGSQSLQRKSRGQSKQEESCEGRQPIEGCSAADEIQAYSSIQFRPAAPFNSGIQLHSIQAYSSILS